MGRRPGSALYRLDSEGPAAIVLRRGTSANDISIPGLRKALKLRIALEGFCARFAARWITGQ
ncbi:MAG: hypothetical protein PVH41_08835, partial [Anaerolineae bacterium]